MHVRYACVALLGALGGVCQCSVCLLVHVRYARVALLGALGGVSVLGVPACAYMRVWALVLFAVRRGRAPDVCMFTHSLIIIPV